ncbi:DUF6635 family protein [Szabonella alba]|uniref:Uncharacterized protein n=1 Tax=Szabonella alba TaxID=2804194 RepID=A0A8K0Y1H1_9RHOB|nr:DUF6635 family protein [Szabonella alba]MBL4919305.1 hypothetical protein [Szabonella alba]
MRISEQSDGSPLPEGRKAQVAAFVQRHFTWPGSLRLHGAAFGLDLLRAPANVLLSPLLFLTRMLAWLCRRIGLVALSGWLMRRRLLLRTAVSARVEILILRELLAVPLPPDAAGLDQAALGRALLAAPPLREPIRQRGSPAAAQAMSDRILDAIAEYSGTRAAMAEFTTALVMLALGAAVFQSLTPGAMSMAPGLAGQIAQRAAIAEFPLGPMLGAGWYSVFPIGPSPRLIALTMAGLVLFGAVVASFAGMIADPVQVRLGIHQRRLNRLMAAVDAEIGHQPEQPFVTREHVLVRVFDLWDAALSLFRAFRG